MKTSNEILQDALIIDTHSCMPLDIWYKREILGRKNILLDDYLPDFLAGHVDVAFACVGNPGDKYRPEKSMQQGLANFAALLEELATCDNIFVLVRNTEEILRARKNGQIGLVFAMEGVDLLGTDVSMLRLVYEIGVRKIGLCWSAESWACDGSRFRYEPEFSYGLTEGGAAVVRYAQELGMIVDTAHMNFQSFWDTMRITTGPIICSHANAFSLAPSFRNIKDDQIRAIAERGGYIGVTDVSVMNGYPNEMHATMDQMGEHYKYIKEIGGAQTLAFAPDYFDYNAAKFDDCDNPEVFDVMSTKEPHAAQSYYRMQEFVELLKAKGFTEEEIYATLGGNVFRVMKEVLG